MESSYESAAVLVGRAVGPLADHLGPFVASLIEQQYASSVVDIKARHVLSCWTTLMIPPATSCTCIGTVVSIRSYVLPAMAEASTRELRARMFSNLFANCQRWLTTRGSRRCSIAWVTRRVRGNRGARLAWRIYATINILGKPQLQEEHCRVEDCPAQARSHSAR